MKVVRFDLRTSTGTGFKEIVNEVQCETMRVLIIYIAVLALSSFAEADSIFKQIFEDLHREPPVTFIKGRSTIRTEWIQQKLDNFNTSDTRTWKMRYMANDQYFKDNGPIFIFVGGEWAISEGYLRGGHMFDMAKDLNSYMFYTEHRYYGKSYPTEDLSTENLQYLSVEQSLADLAHFIKVIKTTVPGLSNSGVILVGGSYSATMVTWFKRLYPEVATGSWGSSAPLLAKVDFTEYKEIVGESIKLVGGQKCYDRVNRAFKQLEEMLANNKADEVKEMFKICNNFDSSNKMDIWSFFSTLSDSFAGLVQGHNAGDIEKACEKILSGEDDTLGVASWLLTRMRSTECIDFSYSELINSLNDTKITDNSIMRQWFYQTCSEYGWYQTSGSKNQPFGSSFPVQLYTSACRDAYGEKFSNATIYDNTIRTNLAYGGMSPNVSNVILTHGQLDPWRMMGVQEHEEGDSNVVPLYAHCKDLGSISMKDTDEMKATKEKVKKVIHKWLDV